MTKQGLFDYRGAGHGPGIGEFIAMMAALMAANALSIDMMLPALPAIGQSLAVHEDNRRQLVVTFFMLGFGGAQIFYGPLADRFGRKRIFAISLAAYILTTLVAAFSASFALLLGARLLQGIAAAGGRVLISAVIRDRYRGEAMARITSIAFIVFMLVPILAPALGQLILGFAGWRMLFVLLAVYGTGVLLWMVLRLPETLAPERRRPLSLGNLREAVRYTLTHRQSIGNTAALTLSMGGVFAFVNSIQQIIFDVFDAAAYFGLICALIALPVAAASYVNSAIVERFGTRRIVVVALHAAIAAAALHLAVAYLVGESLVTFTILVAVTMMWLGLITANIGAMAMEAVGHIAGTASSLQGVITTVGGALIGLAIGQCFNGTVYPLLAGFLLCSLACLLVALWANRHAPEFVAAGSAAETK